MTQAERAALWSQLIEHEGLRLKPYRDTVGKLTIGVGRNLTDKGITEAEAKWMLDHDIQEVIEGLDRRLPWWRSLDSVRRRVLLDMGFNLGVSGLLKFRATLAAVQAGHWRTAADQMLASKWAGQVGRRAVRLAAMMRTGEDA